MVALPNRKGYLGGEKKQNKDKMTICFQAAKYLFPFLIATCFFFFFPE